MLILSAFYALIHKYLPLLWVTVRVAVGRRRVTCQVQLILEARPRRAHNPHNNICCLHLQRFICTRSLLLCSLISRSSVRNQRANLFTKLCARHPHNLDIVIIQFGRLDRFCFTEDAGVPEPRTVIEILIVRVRKATTEKMWFKWMKANAFKPFNSIENINSVADTNSAHSWVGEIRANTSNNNRRKKKRLWIYQILHGFFFSPPIVKTSNKTFFNRDFFPCYFFLQYFYSSPKIDNNFFHFAHIALSHVNGDSFGLITKEFETYLNQLDQSKIIIFHLILLLFFFITFDSFFSIEFFGWIWFFVRSVRGE